MISFARTSGSRAAPRTGIYWLLGVWLMMFLRGAASADATNGPCGSEDNVLVETVGDTFYCNGSITYRIRNCSFLPVYAAWGQENAKSIEYAISNGRWQRLAMTMLPEVPLPPGTPESVVIPPSATRAFVRPVGLVRRAEAKRFEELRPGRYRLVVEVSGSANLDASLEVLSNVFSIHCETVPKICQ